MLAKIGSWLFGDFFTKRSGHPDAKATFAISLPTVITTAQINLIKKRKFSDSNDKHKKVNLIRCRWQMLCKEKDLHIYLTTFKVAKNASKASKEALGCHKRFYATGSVFGNL
jgi:hypothetical protein